MLDFETKFCALRKASFQNFDKIGMADISLLPKEYSTKAAPKTKEAKLFTILSFVLFFAVLGAWGGLYFYNSQIDKEIKKVKEEIEAIPLGERKSQVDKIEEANKKLNVFGGILNNHVYASNIFDEVENFTLKKVYLNEFDVDIKKNVVSLGGITDSYTTFAKQYNELNGRRDTIKKTEIDSVAMAKSGIEFGLTLFVSSNIFLKNTTN